MVYHCNTQKIAKFRHSACSRLRFWGQQHSHATIQTPQLYWDHRFGEMPGRHAPGLAAALGLGSVPCASSCSLPVRNEFTTHVS